MNKIPLQELKDWFHALPEDHKFEFSSENKEGGPDNEKGACGCVLTQFGRFKGLNFERATMVGVLLEGGKTYKFFTDGQDEFAYLRGQIKLFLNLQFFEELYSRFLEKGDSVHKITKKEILLYIPDFLK